MQPPATGRPEFSETKAWWITGLLSVMYVLSFVDRSVLGLLIGPLKAELGATDIQIGLLIGPAFGVFYAILGLPVARLADYRNRTVLIVAGVLIWGAATIGSAFAATFSILLLLRVGLAVGEAVLTPAAYSLISDIFRAERRAVASSIYSATGMAGASIAFLAGAAVVGYVAALQLAGTHLPLSTWRLVLILVGAPSVLAGLLFAVTVREPVRRAAATATPTIAEVGAYLGRRFGLFGPLFLGAGLMQAIIYGGNAWAAEYLRRGFALTPQHAGYMLGIAGLIGGFGGPVAMPALTRYLARRGRPDAVAVTTMIGLAVGAICAGLAPLQGSPLGFVTLIGASTFFMVGGTINVQVALQHLTPDRMRGTFVGLLLMCISLLGLGIGPTLVALISRAVDASGSHLGNALSILAPVIAVPALILLEFARRALVRLGGTAQS